MLGALGLVSPRWHLIPSLQHEQKLEGVIVPGWNWVRASFKMPGHWVMAGLSKDLDQA